jgi:hypothetical protein
MKSKITTKRQGVLLRLNELVKCLGYNLDLENRFRKDYKGNLNPTVSNLSI